MGNDSKQNACKTICEASCDLGRHEGAPMGADLSKEQLEAVLRLAPVGVFLCNEQGRFLSANQKLAELHGFDTVEDLLAGEGHMDQLILSDDAAAREMGKSLEQQDEAVDFEIQIETPSGEKHWRSRSIRVFRKESGEVLFIVGFEVDIDERKELEQMREVGISVARHDLKTPLLSILSGLRLLRKHREEAEREDLLDSLEEEARKAMETIQEGMGQDKIAQGAPSLRAESFDLVPVLGRLGESLCNALGLDDDQLRFFTNDESLDASAPFVVHGEKRLIETLLANLIKNATEASPEGEPVTVTVSDAGDAWVLDVHNLGEVPEKIRCCLFEPYTTEGKSGGAGLGAYSARLITEAHGGKIDFTTTEDEGTHVIVRLPRDLERVGRDGS